MHGSVSLNDCVALVSHMCMVGAGIRWQADTEVRLWTFMYKYYGGGNTRSLARFDIIRTLVAAVLSGEHVLYHMFLRSRGVPMAELRVWLSSALRSWKYRWLVNVWWLHQRSPLLVWRACLTRIAVGGAGEHCGVVPYGAGLGGGLSGQLQL